MKNPKRIKEQFIVADEHPSYLRYFITYRPYLRNSWFRRFSTKQEKSCSLLHEIEYAEYGFKVRVRRGKNLPDSWDDLSSSVNYGVKGWKHNSKRKHQYFREKSVDNIE